MPHKVAVDTSKSQQEQVMGYNVLGTAGSSTH